MKVQDSTIIGAPIDVVWAIYSSVAEWPTWTTSVTSVTLLDGRPLRAGARVRISQPRLPTLDWTVTDVDTGASWTWETRRTAAHTVAYHQLSSLEDGTTMVNQRVEHHGPVGVISGLVFARLTRRYLKIEGRGLKEAAEKVARQTRLT